MSNKPKEFRVGRVKATIWENERDGRRYFDTAFARLYKEGEQWKTTDRFGANDLPLVARVADVAHNWILAQDTDVPDETDS